MHSIETMEPEVLDRAANIIKCLGHPLRIRILSALEDGEKTVSELQDRSEASQATVSQQLATMRGRGIVECRRDGANVFYWITEPSVSQILDCIRQCDNGY